ncbi:DUF6443 domain-containing protein [Foetidibacter luteolus]|uniref:DUF6443 domain-containing protein n=1 Tax=Foetidibacter luteolus TaxID=2608880 RepID=UPI00129A19D0|nr:RHS repeat-associated core domain-containing protein [Foetidibacter luteolus]
MLVNESLFHPFSRAACRAALLLLLLLRGMVSYAGGDEGIPFTQNGIPLRGISQVTLPGGIIESNAFEDEAEIICQYQPNGESSVTIQNVIMLKLREEAPEYIATNGSITVNVDITYGSNSGATTYISRTLTVSYNKEAGSGYQAVDYVKLDGWAYVKVKIKAISGNFGSLNIGKVLQLENNILARRYYTFNHSIKPSFLTASFNGDPADALDVSWSWASFPGNNFTQLEWTWVEDDFNAYYNASNRFQNNATRIDLPGNVNNYSLPLYYDGDGYLYYRVRAVSINATGSRTDGAWSDVQSVHYSGHNNNLNWQVTTSFAEEGKRKTVMQYYDGSLRGRQTVTKDNSTHQTVTAETMYDGQGRPAVQILPAPGSDLVIKYNPNFNLFNQQAENENPANHFDLEPLVSGEMLTLKQDRGAALYYSTLNPEKNSGNNVFLPDAEGYAYTHTRYTPDGTGRVLSQSGVGETFKSGGEHETRYYYGTAAQEELDGLFGTEAGTASHYFKNMVRDANGQMSVSYVDMHGRTIATALAGELPPNHSLAPLDIENENLYYNQSGHTLSRNLLDGNTNIVKNNSIESVNSILVPAGGTYTFNYELDADKLQLPKCSGGTACFSCLYNLQVSITDESGGKGITDGGTIVETGLLVKDFDNIDAGHNASCEAPFTNGPHITDNHISFSVYLKEGSYSVRKTLAISESSLQAFKEQYLAVGLCKTEQQLIDSVFSVMQTVTGCGVTDTTDACETCQDSLGTYSSYRSRYLAGMGANIPAEAVIRSAYITDSLHCEKLCNVVSQRLRAIRQAMLADMRPYSGQYAQHPDSSTFVNEAGILVTLGGAMHRKYNIFSSLYNAGQQPWFKKPRDRQGNAYEYRDEMSLRDTINAILPGMTHSDFSSQFKFSWTESLLPHHPEYAKLKYAEDNLQASYNWIEGFNHINTYSAAATAGYNANPQNSDVFFSGPGSGLKITMDSIVGARLGNSWHKGLNLWQMAYGNVMCNNIFDPYAEEFCYQSAPVTPNSVYTSLSAAQKDAVWNGFKNLYMVVRDSMVNAYLNSQVTVADAGSLLGEKFILRFPSNNSQIASQYNWSWLPSSGVYAGETLPGIALEDSLDAHYASRCGAYIDQWKRTLLQCDQLSNKANKEAIIADITSRMEALCRKGTDEANPYGSSTLPSGTTMPNGDESFEQIIEDVLAANSISKTAFCNPYGINFPKPYNLGRTVSKQYTSLIDTCACKQFQVIKDSASAAGYSPVGIHSLNNFLRTRYADTLTQELYEGLLNCNQLGIPHCSDGVYGMMEAGDEPDELTAQAASPQMPEKGLVHSTGFQSGVASSILLGEGTGDNNFSFFAQAEDVSALQYEAPGENQVAYRANDYQEIYYSDTMRCDTPYYYTLLKPQPLPEFLRCGFRYTERCLTCTGLSTLVAEFKEKFPDPYDRAPVVDTVNVGDDTLQYNLLFERFMNFRTGYSYTWREYANAARNAECDLAAYATNSGSQSILCRNDHPLNDTTGIVSHEDPCQRAYDQSVSIATEIYKKRIAQLLADFETAYRAKCLAAGTDEVFTVSYDVKEYHYTLYYYDMAGNLVKTVPPRGVRPDWGNSAMIKTKKQNNQSQPIDHRLPTRYNYNSLNQVVAQHTPDAGLSLFWYDRLGRLAVSQNAKQQSPGKYSYTLYDVLGRIEEVGEVTGGSAMTTAIAKDEGDLSSWMSSAASSKRQITKTTYDLPFSVIEPFLAQKNLRNRVSWSAVYNDYTALSSNANYASASFYSYDIHGNVDTLLQDYQSGIMSTNNRFKKLIYDYDLISGKVNMVSYQKGSRDGFYHRYAYDAENRLTDVYTSRDSIYWERDAQYDYYRHGPLGRTILGQQAVQGVDYVYTLQGWLKAINPSSPTGQTEGGGCAEGFAPETLDVTTRGGSDPDEYKARTRVRLKEGFESGETNDVFDVVVDRRMAPCSSGSGSYNTTDGYPGSAVARDAYNVTLNYYEGDYKGIVAPSPSLGMAAKLGVAHRPLYNGNISSMAVNVPKLGTLGGTVAGAMVYAYGYDQLNRVVSMDAFKSSDENFNTLTATNDYKEEISYDPNGKILTFNRWGKGRQLDAATYNYYANTNRLDYISDHTGKVTDDVDNQSANNYQWNEIGQITHDEDRGLDDATWTMYGKIESQLLDNGTTINYTYDAAGHRISKTVSGTNNYTEWYVRSSLGDVVSVYKSGDNSLNSGHLTQAEINLYGGKERIGAYKPNVDVQTPVASETVILANGSSAYLYNFGRGKKFFELSDNRGNVLTIISDRKLQHSTDNTIVDYYLPDEISAHDYSSFGALQDGREYGNTPRNTYNGKQLDKELGWQEYGMREYLGGSVPVFATVDPLTSKYPGLTPYQFASNRPIDGVDLDGLEWRPAMKEDKDGKWVIDNESTVKMHTDPNNGIVIPVVIDVVLTKGWLTRLYVSSIGLGALNDNRAKTPEGRAAQDERSKEQLAEAAILAGSGEILGRVFKAGKELYGKFFGSKINGKWIAENIKGWSKETIEYQEYVTGIKAGRTFQIERNGIQAKFDNELKDKLIDAKYSHDFAVDKNGGFANWFEGRQGLLDEARRQVYVANGKPIEWHFATEKTLEATRKLFSENGVEGISLKLNLKK